MKPADFELRTERLGPLPLVNHYVARLGLGALFDRFVPTSDGRTRLRYATGLGVLLRSLLTEREPLYRLGEVIHTFAPEGFALSEAEAGQLSDDALGRALGRLFDADRGSLLTEIVLGAVEGFDLSLDELHNDSTTVKFGAVCPGEGPECAGQEGAVHHLRPLERPPARPVAALGHPERHAGRRGAGPVPLRGRQGERCPHARGELGGPVPHAWRPRVLVRGRQQAVRR